MVVRVHGIDQPQKNDLTLTISVVRAITRRRPAVFGPLLSRFFRNIAWSRFAKSLSPAPIGTRARLCRVVHAGFPPQLSR
jgi:hypothetical protein